MNELDGLDAASWDCCDEHETTYLKDGYCKDCKIEELQAQVDALNSPVLKSEWQEQQKRIEELQEQVDERDALIRDGITHLCSYCMDNKERSWEEMQQHIHVCDKHPLKAAEAKIDKIAELLFGTDEPVLYPVNIDALNDLFRNLNKALEQKP